MGENGSFQNQRGPILLISARADFGGGPQQLFQLVNSLKNEFSFFVACPRNEPYYFLLEQVLGTERLLEIPYRKLCMRSLFYLKEEIRSKKISLIHSHGKGAGVYGRLLSLLTGVPVVHTFHGIHTGGLGTLAKFLYLSLERIFSLFTKQLICVSRTEREQAEGLRIGTEKNRILIENGVKAPDEPDMEIPFSQDPLLILSITRNDFAKNPELLIQIARELKKAGMEKRFKIHAVGLQNRDSLNLMAKDVGVANMICWHLPTKDLKPFFQKAFCYLSTSRWEGMPLAVLEAMSYGRPVVASEVVGNKDLVADSKSGFLYPRLDPAIAAECILRLAQSRDLWKRLGAYGRDQIQTRFSEERMVMRTRDLYLRFGKEPSKRDAGS